jgi:hypothetical protein
LEPAQPSATQQQQLDDLEKYRPEAAEFLHTQVLEGASWDQAFANLHAQDTSGVVQLIPGINPPDGTPMDVVGELEARKSRKEKVLLPDGRAVAALKKGELVEAHKNMFAVLDAQTREDWFMVTHATCRAWMSKNFDYTGKAPTVEVLRKDVTLLALQAAGGDLVLLAEDTYSDTGEEAGGEGALSESDKAVKMLLTQEPSVTRSAQGHTFAPRRWQYQMWSAGSTGVDELNTLGQDGWEVVQAQMVHTDNGVWVSGLLKRASLEQ